MKNIIIVLMTVFTVNTLASDTFNIGHWISNELETNKSALSSTEEAKKDSSLSLTAIILRTRLSYGVSIPFLLKAKVKPEVEFVWTEK